MKPDSLEEGRRWLLQAEQDLKDAEYNFDGMRFHLACFLSQQAAEKALKAFLYAKGEERVLGHSVAELCKNAMMRDERFRDVKNASVLDKYYIPTRYPNGLPGGVPYEAFDETDGRRAIEIASKVIEVVRMRLSEMGRGDWHG